ncbi:MAG TPA: hypothetical protein PKW35_16055 [Nannocystaceae bacterium]|nr:hypothetical protein [Nannocystaceae bacterium]
MTAFDLTDSIHGIHRRLVAQLQERRELPHPTIKGDEGELLWLKVLSAHLPRRYAVRRGIVIDSRGARSDAIDLIVYDPQYTPVFLAQDEHAYVFAEAVYAVFEVKYELDAGNVEYAANKAASVRQLHRTNGPIYHAGGVISQPRTPFVPLAGLLTLGHSWIPKSLEGHVREKVRTHSGPGALDLVLCLEGGLYESGLEPGEADSFEAGPTSFVLFLYSLLHRLQRLGTVPAIVWTEYLRHVRALQREGAG